MSRWERLLHVRFWFGCMVLALIPTALLMWLWYPLRWTFWLFFPAVVALSVMEGGPVAFVCPHCGKRTKAGASVCHHCGRDVLPADAA